MWKRLRRRPRARTSPATSAGWLWSSRWRPWPSAPAAAADSRQRGPQRICIIHGRSSPRRIPGAAPIFAVGAGGARMHPTTEPELVIAVDPGAAKAGIAVLGRDGTLIAREIVETAELLEERLRAWAERGPACLVVGDGTGGPALWRNLEEKG